MKNKVTLLPLFFFFSTFFLNVFSVEKQDYYFRKLNTENGLSQNTVLSILQDKDGFMWFGTRDGLNRYDGNSFKVFKYDENDDTSIGNNYIRSLLQTPDGQLWVGTDMGIYIYHPENNSFTPFDLKTENNECIKEVVTDMQIDQFGNIWIASNNLFRYSPSTGKLEATMVIEKELTSVLSRIWSINIDKDEQIWIGIYHGGIKKYNPIENNFKSYTKDASGNNFSSSLTSKTINVNNDYLLIGSFNEELRIMDKITEKIYSYKLECESCKELFVRDMKVFSDGNCWIGTESGLYVHNFEKKTTIHLTHNVNDKYSLSDNAIYSMYEDKEGGIWIGTYFGGVNYFPRPYTHFKKYYPIGNKNSISGERVSGICEDSSGNIWIGTEDAGLNKLDVKTGKFEHFSPSLNPNTVNYHNIHDIIADDDLLWVGTYSYGINVLNLKTNTWKYYLKGDEEGMLNNNDIFALFRDSSGRIWVGTSTGSFLFSRNTEKFIFQEQIGWHFISDILEDSSGQIWFATSDAGAFRYNPRTKVCTHFAHDSKNPDSICHYNIVCLFIDSKKRMWFASESRGICMFDEKTQTFISYGLRDGLTNDVICKILEDNEGNLWLSSNKGLIQFNPETKKSRTFTQSNGLPGNQFNYKSGYKDKTGKMYFGCLNGLVAFHPAEFKSNNFIPSVAITDFQLLNHEFPLKQFNPVSLELKYDQSSFSIDFAALSYVSPEMNRYAYKMEGLEDDWTYLSAPQKIIYSNLPHGKYAFRVKASNNDGLWNEQGDSLEIVIYPPFWKTTWAYLFYVLAISTILFFLFNYYMKKIERDNRQKQQVFESEKEKEIYNAKIEFFTNVAHEVRTPLTLIKGPLEHILKTEVGKDELQANLNIMEKNTDRLLALINQLLDFRKTESKGFSLTFAHVNVNELLTETHIRFFPLAKQKGLSFGISLPENTVYADIDKEAVTKVISNLFTNAIKHAENKISVELSTSENEFTVKVKNDGILLSEEVKDKIFEPFFQLKENKNNLKSGSGIGLALVKSLVDLHEGSIFLDTKDKQMNAFVVELPLKQSQVVETNENLPIEPETGYEPFIQPDVHEQVISPNDIVGNIHKYNLLVVEDNEELQQFLVEKLKKQYSVFIAQNGIEALDVLKKEIINLIISDIMMPLMDGFELCATVKQQMEYSHIPVILLTAKTNTQSKIAGLECGADAYIEKPFSIEHLQAQIANLFENRVKMREAFVNSPFTHSATIALTKSDEQFLTKLTEVIHKNISNSDFNVDHLAQELFLSRSSLLRKIKGISDATPNDFIRLIRLKRAAEILKEGEYKVNEVCYLVGFTSTSYFTKAFQKQFRMLPKDFVKNCKKKES